MGGGRLESFFFDDMRGVGCLWGEQAGYFDLFDV